VKSGAKFDAKTSITAEAAPDLILDEVLMESCAIAAAGRRKPRIIVTKLREI
jgi:hypothetical protein